VTPVASIREGLENFAGELEAVIRDLPELEGYGGGGVERQCPFVRPGRSQQEPARMECKAPRPHALAGLSDHACRSPGLQSHNRTGPDGIPQVKAAGFHCNPGPWGLST
jgi:hypothetical protein